MKIAFIALPRQEDVQTSRIAPPLPLGYVAALLEQRRHIVRIYDLALAHGGSLQGALAPLRSFRPQLTVVAADGSTPISEVESILGDQNIVYMRLSTALRDGSLVEALTHALLRFDSYPHRSDEQSVIFESLLACDESLDALPYPARHLLSLEQYPLLTLDGELQTTVCVAQLGQDGALTTRSPDQIAAELQSVMREHGIRHFVFTGAPITADARWLDDLLRCFALLSMSARWEAIVDYDSVTAELLERMKQAGCEVVCFSLVAGSELVQRDKRTRLTEAARQVHAAGLGVRADIQLDPPYSMMPSLIDVSATLELDTVHFHVQADTATPNVIGADGVSLEEIAEMARTRYRSSRSRQFFVDRFGSQLGPMLWRVGRAGLLGRTWQRYADGGDEGALAY